MRSRSQGGDPPFDGRYEILQKLGEGGMGAVYRARDLVRGGEEIALKVLVRASAKGRARFLREVEAMRRLDHEGIVRIQDAGFASGPMGEEVPYLTMTYVEGLDLEASLLAGALTPGEALSLFLEVLDAVEEAHSKGVIHRDLKPSNILVDGGGRPHVSDFGLARLDDVEGALTQTGSMLGTPLYMAPEQIEDAKRAGREADVYSLGAILYHILTGDVPHTASTAVSLLVSIRKAAPVSPSRTNPAVGPALSSVCLRALSPDPRHRFPTAAAFREALDLALAGGRRTSAPSRLAMGALLLAGIGFAFYFQRPSSPEAAPERGAIDPEAPTSGPESHRDAGVLEEALAHIESLRKRGDQKEALAQALEACRLHPASPHPLLALGRIALDAADVEGALKLCDEALFRDPRFLEAAIFRAYVRSIEDTSGETSARDLETVLALADASGDREAALAARLTLAKLAAFRRDEDESFRQLAAAQELAPDDPRVALLAGRIAFVVGTAGVARDRVREVERVAAPSSEASFLRGMLAEIEGQPDEAIRAYDEALSLDASNGEALACRGALLLSRGDVARGEHDLDRALSLERRPGSEVALYTSLVERLLVPNSTPSPAEVARAKEFLGRIAFVHNRAAEGFGLAAYFFWFAMDVAGTLQHCNVGLEKNPRQPLCHFYLGMIALRVPGSQNPNEAIRRFEKACEIDPSAGNFNMLGVACLELLRKEEALEAFDQAIRRRPGDPQMHENRARALEALGRHDEAEAVRRGMGR